MLVTGLLAAVVVRTRVGYPRPPRPTVRLTAPEAAFLAGAADATFPPGGALEPSGTEAGVVEYVDRWLDALPRRNRSLIRALLFLMEHATLVFPAPGLDGWRRFSVLRPEQQVTVLRGWARSRLPLRRVAFTSLRAVLAMAYLGSPAVLRRLGLAPLAIESPIHEADTLYPRVGASRDTIRWRAEDVTRGAAPPPVDPRGPLHPDYAEPRP